MIESAGQTWIGVRNHITWVKPISPILLIPTDRLWKIWRQWFYWYNFYLTSGIFVNLVFFFLCTIQYSVLRLKSDHSYTAKKVSYCKNDPLREVQTRATSFHNLTLCEGVLTLVVKLCNIRAEAEFLNVIGTKVSSLLFTVTSTNGLYVPPPPAKVVWNWFVMSTLYCIRKPQVWELSRLCTETSTKLYFHEFGFRFPLCTWEFKIGTTVRVHAIHASLHIY